MRDIVGIPFWGSVVKVRIQTANLRRSRSWQMLARGLWPQMIRDTMMHAWISGALCWISMEPSTLEESL
jgi:hypothetical protein